MARPKMIAVRPNVFVKQEPCEATTEPFTVESDSSGECEPYSEPNEVNIESNNGASSLAKSKVVKPIPSFNNGEPDKEVDTVCTSSDGQSSKENQNRNSPLQQPSLDCTICKNEMFSLSEVHPHPFVPGIGVCTECYNYVVKKRFTKDGEGYENNCRWCRDALDVPGAIVPLVALCGQCKRVFCQDCIVRNFGHKRGWIPIVEDDDWVCFCCDPMPLRTRINEFTAFRKSHKSRPSNPTSRENDNNTELNKSSEQQIQKQKQEFTDMDKALKQTIDACRLCDSGEAARAAKKFKKALQYLEASSENSTKQAKRLKTRCYNGLITCSKQLEENM